MSDSLMLLVILAPGFVFLILFVRIRRKEIQLLDELDDLRNDLRKRISELSKKK